MSFEKEKVKISIEPFYLTSDSDPRNNLYSFEYNVKIENFADEEIQLLERYLLLISFDAKISKRETFSSNVRDIISPEYEVTIVIEVFAEIHVGTTKSLNLLFFLTKIS